MTATGTSCSSAQLSYRRTWFKITLPPVNQLGKDVSQLSIGVNCPGEGARAIQVLSNPVATTKHEATTMVAIFHVASGSNYFGGEALMLARYKMHPNPSFEVLWWPSTRPGACRCLWCQRMPGTSSSLPPTAVADALREGHLWLHKGHPETTPRNLYMALFQDENSIKRPGTRSGDVFYPLKKPVVFQWHQVSLKVWEEGCQGSSVESITHDLEDVGLTPSHLLAHFHFSFP